MSSSADSLSYPSMPNLIFVALPLRVCGNCRHWKGTRVSNGRSGFVCLANSAGRCCNGQRVRDVPEERLGDAAPMSNGDCSHWKSGL